MLKCFITKNILSQRKDCYGNFYNIYEQGACCETDKMMYGDGQLVNSQKQGFVYLCQDNEGNTIDEFTKLVSLN